MDFNLMEVISQQGVIVTRNISHFRGNKKLTHTDLGIPEPPKTTRLGSMKIVPEDCPILARIQQIESEVGTYIKANTHDFCGLARFLPNNEIEVKDAEGNVTGTITRLERTREFLEQKRDEYNRMVAEFFESYESIKESGIEEAVLMHSNKFDVPESVLRDSITNAFPTREKLQKKFQFNFAFMPLADMKGVNKANELTNLCDSFIQSASGKFRELAHQTLSDMSEAIAEGKWNQKTLNRVPKVLEQIRNMSLVPDDDLVNRLEKFNSEFLNSEAKDFKSDEEALAAMQEGLKSAIGDLRNLAEHDSADEVRERFVEGAGRRIG